MALKPREVADPAQTLDHTRNFLDCVKSRQLTNCPVAVGHRSTTATLLGNIALRVGRQIKWNATTEQVIDDELANQLLSYKYRKPWPQIADV